MKNEYLKTLDEQLDKLYENKATNSVVNKTLMKGLVKRVQKQQDDIENLLKYYENTIGKVHKNSLPKKAAITCRVPQGVYDALMRVSNTTGNSISSEIESRITNSFHDDMVSKDEGISLLMRSISLQTAMIIQAYGPIDKSPEARQKVQELWNTAVTEYLPIIINKD